jgi:hypothetical protein
MVALSIPARFSSSNAARGRQRGAEDPDVVGFPELACSGEGVGLAGTCGGADDLDAVARGRQPSGHRGLLAAQVGTCVDRFRGGSGTDTRHARSTSLGRVGDQSLLEREHLRRRVARTAEVRARAVVL